jgi:hypothetical protein
VQVTVTVEPAWPIVKVVEPVLPVWLVSPEKEAPAVAVPALVLLLNVTGVTGWLSPPAPVTEAEQEGVCGEPL